MNVKVIPFRQTTHGYRVAKYHILLFRDGKKLRLRALRTAPQGYDGRIIAVTVNNWQRVYFYMAEDIATSTWQLLPHARRIAGLQRR